MGPFKNPKVRDAPDVVGQIFLQAVKARDKDILDRLLSQNLLFGEYYEHLTDEDKRWIVRTLES